MKKLSVLLNKDAESFCLNYGVTLETLKNNTNVQFKYLCYTNIKYINKIPIEINTKIKTNQTVLVYFNTEPHIEFIIRNMIIQLKDTWDHLIICNEQNYDFMVNIIKNINTNIKIKLYDEEYMLDLDGYKILFYDENTIIYNNISSYLTYDYITTLYDEKPITLRNKIHMQQVSYDTTINIPEHIQYYKQLIDTANVANIIDTQKFNKIINNKMEICEKFYNLLNKYRKTVYIISGIKGGGTLKYINDLINAYNNYCEIHVINSKDEINNIIFFDNDILLVQQLFYTDFTLDDLLNIKKKYSTKIIISIHDFYWFNNDLPRKINLSEPYWHNEYLNNSKINNNITNFFESADLVLHPSKFTFECYKKYFNTNNFKIIKHNDYIINYTKFIPQIINNTINIGFLVDYNIYKGKEKIDFLADKYQHYKNYKINYFIKNVNIKSYEQNNFYDFINKYNIHCLPLLNKWGETYCYALTLYLNSGLPIIYNNFGSLKERIPNDEHYFKVYENENEYIDNNKLCKQFENMLLYIINNGSKNNNQKELEFKTNLFYDTLFDKNTDMTIIHNKIKPISIYFPQFHKIKENDINYYENMNDIMNLNKYLTETNNEEQLLKPNLNNYDLSNLTDYDLTNSNIIFKQINYAKKYGIYGFGIYYYWFSHNEITDSNVIMEKCYNIFFSKILNDFKVFFIWANEDWSNNPAFNTKKIIKNEYNDEQFKKNIDRLIAYFCHDNYYKINNSPILFIHHPWLISEDKLKLFTDLLNNECKKNGLNDVLLYLNSSEKKYNNYPCYAVNPNYKIKLDSNIIINKRKAIDYEKYLNYINNKPKDNIECLFFSFNNTARLYYPNNLNLRTHTVNNNIINQGKFIDITLKNKNDILLINSWNEWGEDMSIEENEKNNKLLNLIKIKLLRFIHLDE